MFVIINIECNLIHDSMCMLTFPF